MTKVIIIHMIIKKNTVNTCVFSLSEKTTLDPVYYLFEITSVQDGSVVVFLATDISPNKASYNEFLIEETESVDLTDGKINLPLIGTYTYKVFEQSSSTNLVVADSGAEVENGKIDLIQDATERESFTDTRTIKVFNG